MLIAPFSQPDQTARSDLASVGVDIAFTDILILTGEMYKHMLVYTIGMIYHLRSHQVDLILLEMFIALVIVTLFPVFR